jgi:RES domain-containing protein
MDVWRISRFAGLNTGPSKVDGRWNRAGERVIYTSDSLAHAIQETLVHSMSGRVIAKNLLVMRISIPEWIVIRRVHPGDLPPDWRTVEGKPALQEITADWIRKSDSAVLCVPSVLAAGNTYLLNPLHADYIHIAVNTVSELDDKLLKTLEASGPSSEGFFSSRVLELLPEVAASVEAAIPQPPPDRVLKIFLNYAAGDIKAAREVRRRFLEYRGVSVWFDEDDLLPGQDREYEIRKAIKSAEIVATLLSMQALSTSSSFHTRLRRALDVADEQPEGTIFIIALKLEPCDVPENLEKWQPVNVQSSAHRAFPDGSPATQNRRASWVSPWRVA